MLMERKIYSLKIAGVVSSIIGIIAIILFYVAGYNPMVNLFKNTNDKKYNHPINASAFQKSSQTKTAGAGVTLTDLEKPKGPNVFNAASFGAKGDNATDDTDALQRMIDAVPNTGGEVFIPEGIFLVDAVKSLRLKSNIAFYMTPNTILKAIPNGATHYSVLQIADIHDVKIVGGTIMGERDEHKGTRGEWGMGIRITGSKNIAVHRTIVKNCWGDGVYIASGSSGSISENVRIVEIQADNNRRQGISLISGRNIEIVQSRVTDTHGTPPAAGLDIEPNRMTDILQNIYISDLYTANNEGAGIGINLVKLQGSIVPVSIKIANHTDNGSKRGFSSVNGTGSVPGSLVIDDAVWENNKLNGFAVTNHDYRSYSITVNNPHVIDANTTGPMGNTTGSAFAMYTYKPEVTLGNIHLNHPAVTDTRAVAKITAGFYVADSGNKSVKKLTLMNPRVNGTVLHTLKAAASTGVEIR